MSIERVQCKRDCDNDWVTMSGRCILCDEKSSEWWDTEGATEIYITFSDKPHEGAYKVNLRKGWFFHIRDELQGKWHAYGIFEALQEILREQVYHNGDCYMGIEII